MSLSNGTGAMTDSYVIWGGYGGYNLGDEAILWAMSQLISRLRPSARKYVLIRGTISPSIESQYKAWGLTPIDLFSFRSLAVLRKATVIAGGGGLLDQRNLAWPVVWTSLVLVLGRALGRRPLILCIGAEPIERKATRLIAKYCYSMAEVCTFRDPESADVAREIGIPANRVVVAKDVVFSSDASLFPRWKPGNGGEKRITIIVSKFSASAQGNADYVANLTRGLLDTGWKIRIVPHDLRKDFDMDPLQRLEKEFINEPRVSICKPQSLGDALELYADSDAVVSNRYHPLILASLIGTLPIAILGTAKVGSLVDALAIPALSETGLPGDDVQEIRKSMERRGDYLDVISSRVVEFKSIVETSSGKFLREG